MFTVVIPTHKRSDLLQRTLVSLADCESPTHSIRTIVIENGCRDGAEQAVRQAASWLNAEYAYTKVGNKSTALNSALDRVGNELLVFLDDDVRLSPRVLVEYEAAARSKSESVFFGGPIACDYEVAPPEWIRLPASARGWSLPPETVAVEEPVFLGFNWAAFSNDLRSAGGFDTRVGPGGTSGGRGQETEMQARLLERGLRGIYVPNAMVWHYVPKERCSVEWSLQRAFQSGISEGLKSNTGGSPTLFGYPRWMIRDYLTRCLQLAWAHMRGGRSRRFEAWHRLQFTRGNLLGAKRQMGHEMTWCLRK